MKRTASILGFCLYLAACNNGTSQSIDSTVQRDTLKTNKIIDGVKKDSIIKNGEYIQYYKNGVTKMRGEMKDGKREGLWKSFYENGLPWSETTFKNGIKNGKTATWYENEKKRYDGYFKDDAESGKWTFWDEKGNLVTTKDYDLKH
jgi:antitoxin component YwqK of YwqJK toxin-antitoxin module